MFYSSSSSSSSSSIFFASRTRSKRFKKTFHEIGSHGRMSFDRRTRSVLKATSRSSERNEREEPLIVAITGATGFVGRRLVQKLLEDGNEVRVLTRGGNSASARLALVGSVGIMNSKVSYHKWETITGKLEWTEAVKGTDAVVNLAGAPVASRWSEEYKDLLISSRVNATNHVVDAINRLPENERPSLVSSSAVGYYGTTTKDETWTENRGAGGDFLAKLCGIWESTAKKAKTDVTVIRTGVVLEKSGGALAKILPLFYLYSGGPVGNGKQWVSWIHREDLVDLMIMAIKNPKKFKGTVNGTAPEPTTMNGLCNAIANATGKPNWLPAPGFAVKILLGEGATVVLDGQKVVPEKTQSKGYKFKYTNIDDALEAIVNGN